MDKTQVLIVEDQLLAAKMAQFIVNKLNCSADVAPDGRTALKCLRNKKYDLVLMDLGLPDINGCDLTKEIRSREDDQDERIPIIALSANINGENRKECISSGMDAVFTKPLLANTARNIIDEFVLSRKN